MAGWKRWVLLIGGGLIAAVLTGAGLLAWLVSRVDVRAEIERAVENATGRDVVIAGDVGVIYWPVLGVRAGDVTIANVEGGYAPAFISAEDIDVGVELRPLLDRQIHVRRLVLQHPAISLEIDEQGQPNWILTPRTQPGPPQPGQPSVDVGRTELRGIRINDGEVSYRDARGEGQGWVIGDVDLSTALTSLDEPMRARGSIRYNEQNVDLDMQIGQPGAAMRGQVTPISIDIQSELIDAEFDGQTIAASGELAGTMRANGPSLRRLAAWVGSPMQGGVGFEQFAVTGRLGVGNGAYQFSNAGFALDLVRGRGDFILTEVRGKPYLSGRLELFDFDLNPYLTGEAPPAPADAPQAVAAATDAADSPTAQIAAVEAPARAVDVSAAPSDQPIDFTGLQAFNADLELVTHAMLVQHLRIDRSQLNLVINDGYLAATLHNVSLYGGSGRGRFEIDAREPATRIVQDLAFSNLDARRFLGDAINFSNIEGRMEGSISVRAQGRTQPEFLSSLDGRTHVEIVSGTLHGVDLGGVATTIRNALRGELIAPEAETEFHGISATFAIADGVLASDDLSFNTPNLRIPGIGIIDVPRRRLDLRLSPRSPRGGVAVPFSIRGPWGQFSYASDMNDRVQRELLPRVREVEAASRQQN